MRAPLRWTCVLLLSGCAVGPDYQRPALDVPDSYRGDTAGSVSAGVSIGLEPWWDLFDDPVLQQLMRAALQRNYDLRVAAQRVLQAQAQLGIIRANEFPTLAAGAGGLTERSPKLSNDVPAYQANAGEVDVAVLWNLDFWGKYRRATEAARANLLASEWGRRAVMSSVVASVAAAYFTLCELDLALDVSKRTLSARQASLQLTQLLANNGSASMLDALQAQQLVYTAAETIPDIERQIAQQENVLSALLGENPAQIARGRSLLEQPLPPAVPAGLPSELIERRPDIQQAEQNLIAANAQIGVAKAAFFPSISLTGTAGFESNMLGNLFTGSSTLWDAAGTVAQPILEGGALRGGMRLARAQQQQMLLTYQQTVMNAFQQVSSALVAYQKLREFREQQQFLSTAAREADRISNILYEHGGTSYLKVLISQTNDFGAQLNLAQAMLSERLALIQLYNALGGGWQP